MHTPPVTDQFRIITAGMHTQELTEALNHFPGPDQRHACERLEADHEGEGADLVVGELADTLRQMRTEASLLRYLSALRAVQRSAFLQHTRRITRIRLQACTGGLLSTSFLVAALRVAGACRAACMCCCMLERVTLL